MECRSVSSMPPVADVVAKVSDFGLSTEAELALEFRGAVVDNPTWTAPEILSKKKFTIKVDVYSFGVILWEMITRKFFFGEIKFMSELEALVRSGKRPPIPNDCAPSLRILIDSCWAQEPAKRPVFPDIRKIISKVAAELGISETGNLAQSDLLKKLPALVNERRNSVSSQRVARDSSGSIAVVSEADSMPVLFEKPQTLVPANDFGVTVLALVGPHLWSGNSRGDILVFDLATRVLIHQTQHVPEPEAPAREGSPGSQRAAAITSLFSMGHSVWCGSSDGSVTLWSRNLKVLKQLKKHSDSITYLGSEGSETVLSACVSGQIRRWNIVSFKYSALDLEVPISCMAQLGVNYVLGSNNNVLLLCPDKSCKVAAAAHSGIIHSIHVVGERVWTASSDKTIRLWYLGSDARSLVPAKVLNGHSSRVFCLAKDLRQELVFSGSWDMVIMIWNAEQQKFVGKVAQAHSDAVTQLLYTSINGCEYLISGSSDRSIALYRRKQSGSRDDLEVYKELGERTEKKHQDDQLLEFLTPAERQYLELIDANGGNGRRDGTPGKRNSIFEALSPTRSNATSPARGLRSSSRVGNNVRQRGFSTPMEGESPTSGSRSPHSLSSSTTMSPASGSGRTSGSTTSGSLTKVSGTDSARMSAVMDGILKSDSAASNANVETRRRRSNTVGSGPLPTRKPSVDEGHPPALPVRASAAVSSPSPNPSPFSKFKRLFRRNSEATVVKQALKPLQLVAKKRTSIEKNSSDEGEDDSTQEEDKIVFL